MLKRKKSFKKQAPQARLGTSVPSGLNLYLPAGVALIVVAVFISYIPSISGGFIWDDELLITQNSLLKVSDGLYQIWCTTEATDYWPVINTTFWIEWRLWGINPIGYHAVNVILHVVEALLIWLILRKLSIPGAFLAAAIFAVHPVNVESVAWIAQRKNTMAMLFFLLSILWYLKFVKLAHRPTFGRCPFADKQFTAQNPPSTAHCFLWYWLSLLAFVLAMLGKGSVAVLPMLLLGVVWWLRPLTRRDLAWTAPFFAVAAALAGVNVWFQTHGMGEVIRTAGFTERLLGAGSVVWFYLYKALLPIDLAFVYTQWKIEAGNPLWWLPLLAALAVTAVLWMYRKGWGRPLLFSWGFFCVALIPVMGFTDVYFMRFSLVADHYQHIAIIGVIALATAGWSIWHRRMRGASYWAASAIPIAAAATLASLTWQQSGLYRDEITLYGDTLQKNPNCWLAHNNLGYKLSITGRPQEAIEHYMQALVLKPDYSEAHNNLGVALLETGRPEDASEHLKQALKLDPNSWEAHNNLSRVFLDKNQPLEAIEQCKQVLKLRPNYPPAQNNWGLALEKEGRLQEAIEHFNQALALKPDYAEGHNNLATALIKIGRLQEAIEHCEQAIRLKSDYAKAYNNLGIASVKMGQPQKAIEYYQQAIKLNPGYADAHNNLGSALIQIGRIQEAIEHCRQALAINPNFLEAHNTLGNAFQSIGQYQQAIEHYEAVLKLDPSFSQAHVNLGSILNKTGKTPEAIEHYEKALRINPDSFEAHNNLANAFSSIGQNQPAIEHYLTALQLNPNYPQVHVNLGSDLVKTGRFSEAIEHYRQALQLAPDSTDLYLYLASTYAKNQQSSEAVAFAQKGLDLARSRGQAALARQIEDWLNSYRAGQTDTPTEPRDSKSAPPTP